MSETGKIISFFKIARWGILLSFLLVFLTGIVSGLQTGIETGNYVPLADNTIGLILDSDNQALKLEKDLVENNFESVPEEYRLLVKERLTEKIVNLIIANLLIIYALGSLIHWLLNWSNPQGTRSVLFALILTLLIYAAVSIAYFMVKKTLLGEDPFTYDTLLAGLPFKSIIYGIKALIGGLI